VLVTAGVFSFRILAQNENENSSETLGRSASKGGVQFTVDVAQDGGNYVQNSVDPSAPKDLFARGDTGILDGTIYPAGTLPDGHANNDPNAPGGIGKYRWIATYTTNTADFLKSLAHEPGAPPVVAFASELFSLPDDGATILTTGVWPNVNFTLNRAVLGGSGRFRDIVGESRVQNLGENRTGFCNLRVTFILRKANH
jgi:hypothetical protein